MEFKSIKAASAMLGVTPATLRRWERDGVAIAVLRTPGGHRRYDLSKIGKPFKIKAKKADGGRKRRPRQGTANMKRFAQR